MLRRKLDGHWKAECNVLKARLMAWAIDGVRLFIGGKEFAQCSAVVVVYR